MTSPGGAGQRLGSFEHRGRRVAFATAGGGPPLLCDLGRLGHLDVFWRYAPYRHLVEGLARQSTVVRFDRPGCGLSDRSGADFSLEGDVALFDRLLDWLGLESVPVVACGTAAKTAIAYAALRPERVARLALFGARPGPVDSGRGYCDTIEALLRAEPDVAIEVLARRSGDGCGPAAIAWLATALRQVASPDVIARWIRESTDMDVRPLMGRVRCPTLVLHRRGDPQVGLREARDVAAQVPDGLLVPLDGTESVLWEGDVGPVVAQLVRFLGAVADPGGAAGEPGLTGREHEVARLVADGLTNVEIGLRLGIGRRTVESHLERARSKLGLRSRTDLAAWATRASGRAPARRAP